MKRLWPAIALCACGPDLAADEERVRDDLCGYLAFESEIECGAFPEPGCLTVGCNAEGEPADRCGPATRIVRATADAVWVARIHCERHRDASFVLHDGICDEESEDTDVPAVDFVVTCVRRSEE